MKTKTITKTAILVLAVMSFACGGGESTADKVATDKTPVEVEAAKPTPAVIDEPIVEEEQVEEVIEEAGVALSGEAKIGNSDCLSCHLVERKVIGPSFKEIAAEYKPTDENITKLANKVIKGGTGVWGETAMPPHPTLNEEDAKDMVKYILSLYE
ncbi:c-type cytochrome [Algoriphagus winogradskyi]|jgi:cytochrome c|uniref:Cytochrome c n=1 Tax=Algoriphagus winogradskyi TaxID=237017 RepID=A0ABY1NAM3_9BACT|nr:c-type cytochrome [Algoriphagus winogradskyi]SMP04915.1 cytochrome c [Algoriphagus winogradskyi]